MQMAVKQNHIKSLENKTFGFLISFIVRKCSEFSGVSDSARLVCDTFTPRVVISISNRVLRPSECPRLYSPCLCDIPRLPADHQARRPTCCPFTRRPPASVTAPALRPLGVGSFGSAPVGDKNFFLQTLAKKEVVLWVSLWYFRVLLTSCKTLTRPWH